MKITKKCTCRWWDGYMDCCRHPHTYDDMKKLGDMLGLRPMFVEYACHCKKNCGYEKVDKNHPVWDALTDPPKNTPETPPLDCVLTGCPTL